LIASNLLLVELAHRTYHVVVVLLHSENSI